MTRFVILHHRLPEGRDRQSHWDLMIECEGELLTWALDEYPQLNSSVSAIELANHRLDYLAYEGPVSGGRGEVKRVESGVCTILQRDALRMLAELKGKTLRCLVSISRAAKILDDSVHESGDAPLEQPDGQRCTVFLMPVSSRPK